MLGLGSPPRARGRADRLPQHAQHHGITPACAGKSLELRRVKLCIKDHPRVRGEEKT